MSRNKNNNSFLLQGSILAAASLIVRIIGLFYRVPMQRIIGDEGMGYYSIAYNIYNIVLILSSYSLPLAVSKLVAARETNRQYKNSYRVFISALIIAMVVGLVAASILFFGAETFSLLLNNNTNVALPLRVLAPTIFVFAIMGVFRGFYQGKGTMIPTAISQVVEQLIKAIVSIVASYYLVRNFSASVNVASYGAAGGTLGTLVGAIIALFFLLFVYIAYKPILNKQLSRDHTRDPESYKDISKLIALTVLPIVVSQTVYHISGVIDDSFFSHIMNGKEISAFDRAFFANKSPGDLYTVEDISSLIGLYSGKYRLLTNVPVAIASAIATASITSISAAKARGLDGVIRRSTHAAIKFCMIIAIPATFGMAILASPILQLLFNDSSVLALNLLKLGSVAIVFFSLSTVSTSILQGINKLKIPVINSTISLVIHIILVYVLLKFTPLSTYGLVIGNVTFAMVTSILNWIAIEKYLNYRQEIVKTFLIPTISSVIMAIVVYFSYKGLMTLTGLNWLSTLISILVAIIIYLIAMLLLKGISEEEINSIPKGDTIVAILKKLRLL